MSRSASEMNCYFFQVMITPHMAALAAALVDTGCSVTYVYGESITEERKSQGWVAPPLGGLKLMKAPLDSQIENFVGELPRDAVFLCQGLRGNGYVSKVQRALERNGLRYWAMMETLDYRGALGWVRPIYYKGLIRLTRKSLNGVLAIGVDTKDWLLNLDPSLNVQEFAYFPYIFSFEDPERSRVTARDVVFAGQVIKRKNLMLLIRSLERLDDYTTLTVIGDGAQRAEIESKLSKKMRGRVCWMGTVSQDKVPALLSQHRVLVLPSLHDGWGAIACESLSVGTPVICSDKCGVADVVALAPGSEVFDLRSENGLLEALQRTMRRKWGETERVELREWSKKLSATDGAKYLLSVLSNQQPGALPWK